LVNFTAILNPVQMKKLAVIILILSLGAVSCRTNRRMVVVDTEPPVVLAPVEEPEPIPDPVVDEEIPIRYERVTFEKEEDKLIHDPNVYFVIVGSFRSSENARRFSEVIENQGLNPVILLSETGLHRISVHSYTNEESARARIQQIRRDFPDYHDTWLLIRQKN
jgi:hypothetical protein